MTSRSFGNLFTSEDDTEEEKEVGLYPVNESDENDEKI